MRRTLVEYVRSLVRGYVSFVVGALLSALGVAGIFIGNAQTLHIAGVVGLIAGSLVAPFLAFHRLRIQRDEAFASSQSHGLVIRGPRPTNDLSFGSWSLDGYAQPATDGIAFRALVALAAPLQPDAALTDTLAHDLREAMEESAVEGALAELVPEHLGDWQVVSPTNDWVITLERGAIPIDDLWELAAKVVVQLPRSFRGRWPFLFCDVYLRPLRDVPAPEAIFNPALSPKPEGRALLDLAKVRGLLRVMALTLVEELSAVAFLPIADEPRRWWRRLLWRRRPLPLIGPNVDVLSRPYPLADAFVTPPLLRRPGGPDTNRLIGETPGDADAYAADVRRAAIDRGLLQALRAQEYEGGERWLASLDGRL